MNSFFSTSFKKKLKFSPSWYEQIVENGNEKIKLARFIKGNLLKAKTKKLLEIGMGTRPIFSDILANHVDNYTIIEREAVPNIRISSNVKMIQQDFEEAVFRSTFDLILLSHVIYYFSDLGGAIKKAVNLLGRNGRAVFVVNGVENDYGRVKRAFAKITGKQSIFTYERLHEVLQLQKLDFEEYTIQTSIQFDSHHLLYERLRLFFDLFPEEYSKNKNKIIDWLKNNIKTTPFLMDQKIVVARHPFGR